MLSQSDRNEIIKSSISKSNMEVPVRMSRFPPMDGMQQKVTLVSSISSMFYNIGFIAGIENTINGNIADELLNIYPDIFKIIKVNGKLIMHGTKEKNESDLKSSIIAQLREDFDLVPKKDNTKRSRPEEEQLVSKTEQSRPSAKDSSYKV